MASYLLFSFVHSASNFLTSTQCGCQSPLICDHGQQFAVKLSDFDSALEVTKVQTRHSVLRQLYRNNPTGTPGYRPPEVCVSNWLSYLVRCVTRSMYWRQVMWGTLSHECGQFIVIISSWCDTALYILNSSPHTNTMSYRISVMHGHTVTWVCSCPCSVCSMSWWPPAHEMSSMLVPSQQLMCGALVVQCWRYFSATVDLTHRNRFVCTHRSTMHTHN